MIERIRQALHVLKHGNIVINDSELVAKSIREQENFQMVMREEIDEAYAKLRRILNATLVQEERERIMGYVNWLNISSMALQKAQLLEKEFRDLYEGKK